MHRFCCIRLLFLSMLLTFSLRQIQAEDLPQLGARFTRNPVSSEKHLPDHVSATDTVGLKWKAKLGSQTYSTPVIANGRVFIGTNNDSPRDERHQGDRGILMCLDEQTGELQWQLVVPKLGDDPFLDWPKVGIASPPTVEGDRAYVLTNRGELVCLDVHGMRNGNDGPFQDEAQHQTPKDAPLIPVGPLDADIIWLTDLEAVAGIWHHDTAYGNPLLHGDFLYLNSNNAVDNSHRVIRKPDAPSLLVFDKQTGRLVAQDKEHIGPNIFHNTYSSPSLGKTGDQLVVCFGGGDGVLYGFEALTATPPAGTVADLKLAWKFDADPTAPKENVHRYISNRKVSPSTIMTPPVFVDGRIYFTAGGDIWWGKYQAWVKCVEPRGAGDVTNSAGVWSYAMKHSCSMPAVTGDLVFVCDTGNKTLNCIDQKTGQEVWTHPLQGEIWSSPLVADGKVYIGTRKGKFFILSATRDKKLLCETDFGAPLTGALAVAANGVLYVASHEYLYAFGQPAK